MKQQQTKRPPPRERLLAAAEELFYREGIRGVGVEAIAQKAKTTKMALYRHFESKDALVAEWLRQVVLREDAVLERLALEHPGAPREQLLGWVRFLARRLAADPSRGCAFINSVAELPDVEHPARQVIVAHKLKQSRRVADLLARAGVPHPEKAASQLLFFIAGARVSAQYMGGAPASERLLQFVDELLGEPDGPRTSRRRARRSPSAQG